MDLSVKKFLKILRLELEHLQDRMDVLEDDYRGLRRQGEASAHLVKENLALFESEKRSFQHFITILDGLGPEEFTDVTDAACRVKQCFVAEIEASGLARAAYVSAERKIDRAARYVRE